ncbi:hypothetical protein FIBSPDRAFT_1040264 [Athelia psychrophila]|uniref:DUF6534 domain-containing protein n=1 Tax=Athelia psychrophila TaxID=1759441 RepID=A0A166QQZ1_9AGAM|nr:hypothetical protein FIBSPDRAFT_1040264 [Fibularhizoctonia sp. CBS 109695]
MDIRASSIQGLMVSDDNPAIRSLGPFLVGVVAALVLYGVEVAQMYHYLRRAIYVKPWIKCVVVSLFLLETFQSTLLSFQIYKTLIVFRTDIGVTVVKSSWNAWMLPLQIISTGVTVFIAELFFLWTVHVVIRKRPLTYTIFFFGATGFVGSIVFGFTSIFVPNFVQWKKLDSAMATWLVSTLIADTLTAFSLARYLNKRRRNPFTSGDAVSRFISMILATGMVTSLASIVCIITFMANGPHLAFDFMLSKLYVNCVLSMLNSRLYEDPDSDSETQTRSSAGGLQLTDMPLDATWCSGVLEQ